MRSSRPPGLHPVANDLARFGAEHVLKEQNVQYIFV